MSQAHAHAAHDHHDDHHLPTGWRRWVYSTNHKDIGTMYLIFAVVAGLIGGAFSVLMRAELKYPGDGILGGYHQLFNVLVNGPDRKCTRLNSSHYCASRMPYSA